MKGTVDERFLEWLCLLPPGSRLAMDSAPTPVQHMLAERSAAHADTYLGWRTSFADLPPTDGYQALVLVNPRGIDSRRVQAHGFGRSLAFCVLPSLADPRVFVPLDNPSIAARGLDFLAPQRPRARLTRTAIVQLARLGQLHRVGDRILLARRTESELERWLAGRTQLPQVYLAIAPGAISHKRKLTIQVMARDGRVVGFAKLARSMPARAATRGEMAWLRALAGHRELDGLVPRLIDDDAIGEDLIALTSPGPTRPAPATFDQAHWDFLSTLSATTGQRMLFSQSTMWASLHSTVELLDARLSAAWRSRLRGSLERLGATLGAMPVRVSLAHRDFQPGNMRQRADGRLFVYDWEGAQAESSPLYDFFNFTFLRSMRASSSPLEVVGLLLDRAHALRPRADLAAQHMPAAFAAYLVDHAARRLTNSDLTRDARSAFVLDSIALLLDRQAEWWP